MTNFERKERDLKENCPEGFKAKMKEISINKTKAEDKIPIHEKSLYGTGGIALHTTNNMMDNQIQNILVYGLGMSPIMNSVMLMIFRLWDAFIDPLAGWISDNTRTRFGRRRPFMFVATFAMALILPFVWRFNQEWAMIWIAVWFTLFGILMSTATTAYNIPFQTLKLEMTPDYHERTSINVYAGIFIKIFMFFSPWVWAMTQLPFFTGQPAGEEANSLLGIRNITLWVMPIIIVMGLIPTFICKERYYHLASKQKKEPFWKSFKMTLKSQPFRLMLLFILFLNLEGLVLSMGGYIKVYYVCGGDKVLAAKLIGIGGTASAILGLLSLPVFGWLSRKYGKQNSLLLVVGGQIAMALSILIFFNPNYPYLSVVPHALNGILISGLWTIVASMKADIVDDDELINKERREGSFESVFSWFQKFSGTLFLGLSGFIVVWLGFDIKVEEAQIDGVFMRIILAMALIPAILSVLEFLIIKAWPLTEERMAEIRNNLEDRRGNING